MKDHCEAILGQSLANNTKTKSQYDMSPMSQSGVAGGTNEDYFNKSKGI